MSTPSDNGCAARSSPRVRGAERQLGMSMIELVVAATILGLVMALVASTLVGSVMASAHVHTTTEGSQYTEHAVDSIARHILSGTVFTRVNDITLDVQEPVDVLGDGNVFNELGELQLGAAGELGWRVRYIWVATGIVREADNVVDLNGDGDRIDEFLVGELRRRVLNATLQVQEEVVVRGGNVALQPSPTDPDPRIPALFTTPFDNGVAIQLTSIRVLLSGAQRVTRVFTARRVVAQRT